MLKVLEADKVVAEEVEVVVSEETVVEEFISNPPTPLGGKFAF